MSSSKNDLAWQQLFDKYKIIDEVASKGYYEIASSTINEFREARLMTKFDFKSQLPALFAKNNLSILPISRGNYVISTFETFKEFDTNEVEIVRIEFPSFIESIDYNTISSESTALNCAFIAGILEDFAEDEALKPTVNGRMSSGQFDFSIQTQTNPLNITVDRAQLEIDGGYEGVRSLSLIEAKNNLSRDFLIRQLYYPFRLWQNKISKPIQNLFLTYSNGVFHFRAYIFEDINNYNSIQLVKQKKYILYDGAINMETIQSILQEVEIVPEPQLPFPQADAFDRIINLCELLNDNTFLNKEDITENYDFDQRQTNYYTDAARYLGLIDKRTEEGAIRFYLSASGEDLFKKSIAKRQIEFVKAILAHSVFNRTLSLYLEKASAPSKEEIVALMKSSKLYNIDSESTFRRRASTISRWVDWILSLIEE
jgi:hypothetical protein